MSKSPSATLQIEANELYEPLWKARKRYYISIGGRGGARSYENSQRIVAKLKQTKERFRAAIMRAVHADIRHSIWQECVDRVEQYGLGADVHIADSVMEMTCGKNSINAHGFKKSSSDRTAKLKSLAGYTDAFIEEAEEIAEGEFQQLDDSLRAEGSRIHLMLNTPPKNHWIIKRWFNLIPHPEAEGFFTIELKPEYADEVVVIFSDHTKNPFLANEVHTRYEAYKATKPQYYWHMIRGLSPEVLQGKIYSGWQEIEDVPHEARFLGRAEDFGFDPDPYALVDIYYYNGGYILDEQLYQTGLIDDDTARIIRALPNPNAIIIADGAEPKAIEAQRRRGLNVRAADKGPGSVQQGIKHVQGLRISYTKRSVNLKMEYESYAWKRTKDAVEDDQHLGIEDPACPNHLMSAARYGLTMLARPAPNDDHYDRLYGAAAISRPPHTNTNPAI